MTQRQASAAEKAALRAARRAQRDDPDAGDGAAGRRGSDGGAVLTELKGVDGAYPLYGTLTRRRRRAARAAGADAILIAPALAERLALRPGDRLRYGDGRLPRRRRSSPTSPTGSARASPSGPVAIVSMDGPAPHRPGPAGQPLRQQIPAPPARRRAIAEAVSDRLETRFPPRAGSIKDRDRAAPGASRFFERMGQFLAPDRPRRPDHRRHRRQQRRLLLSAAASATASPR